MPSKTANSVATEAQKVINVWTANPTFSMGEVTLVSFTAAKTAVDEADAAVEAKNEELTGLQNDRDDKIAILSDLATRARSGIKSTFGPDSTQYEQAGGTRKSERKPRSSNSGLAQTPAH